MNYRHAYHAGNHTEVFKHAAYTLLLEHLLKKPTPFAVLDTHAGIGAYDLHAVEAIRTNEKESGAAKIHGQELLAAPTYSRLLNDTNPGDLKYYPGSPEIARRLLRPEDRLLLCELHVDDVAKLRLRYRREENVIVHHRDAYEGIGGLLPPPERRGIVFMDPPYERRDEAELISKALRVARTKWATGIYAVWYPIKTATIGDDLEQGARSAGFAKLLRVEFCPFMRDDHSLAGSGLVICNPPWQLDVGLLALCRELVPILGSEGCTWSVEFEGQRFGQ